MLYLDEVKTYNENKNANEKFFNKVLGIKKPKSWKYNSDFELDNEPWDYYEEDNKPTGTLYTITASTDLNVTAFPVKEGKAYTKVCFVVSNKKSFVTKDKVRKLETTNKKIINNITSTTKRRRSASSPQTMKNLFNDTMFLDSCQNPINDESIPQVTHISIPRDSIQMLLDSHNSMYPNNVKTLKEFGEGLGYEMDENGDFIKQMNKPLIIE